MDLVTFLEKRTVTFFEKMKKMGKNWPSPFWKKVEKKWEKIGRHLFGKKLKKMGKNWPSPFWKKVEKMGWLECLCRVTTCGWLECFAELVLFGQVWTDLLGSGNSLGPATTILTYLELVVFLAKCA